jgi:hypothetical protein
MSSNGQSVSSHIEQSRFEGELAKLADVIFV